MESWQHGWYKWFKHDNTQKKKTTTVDVTQLSIYEQLETGCS